MPFRGALSVLAVGLLAVGCGGDETTTVTVRETVTETATSSVPGNAPAVVALYFLEGGKVAPEQRGIVSRPDIATTANHPLFAAPESYLTRATPPETRLRSLGTAAGVASIELSPPLTDPQARAQIVYTLTRFDTVRRVSFNGGPPLGRGAFEEQTPAILVESPLPGEEVESGFEVSGTANTFEANFQYELRGADDGILRKHFVTATSGSGTRGTFSFTVAYEVPSPHAGRLVVFEISAEDGSRINESEIPLQLD
jgi:germination protein M